MGIARRKRAPPILLSPALVQASQPTQQRRALADRHDREVGRWLRVLGGAGLMAIEVGRLHPFLETEQHSHRGILRRGVAVVDAAHQRPQPAVDLVGRQPCIWKQQAEQRADRRECPAPRLPVVRRIAAEMVRGNLERIADLQVALRLQRGDRGNHVALKLAIDRRMDAADVVDLIGQVLLGEDVLDDIAPPVRGAVADVPIEVAIDQRDGVEKLRRAALAEELMPVRRIAAVAWHRDAELTAKEDREPVGLLAEHGLAEQGADAMPRPAAVLRRSAWTRVQRAEPLSRHTASLLETTHSQTTSESGGRRKHANRVTDENDVGMDDSGWRARAWRNLGAPAAARSGWPSGKGTAVRRAVSICRLRARVGGRGWSVTPASICQGPCQFGRQSYRSCPGGALRRGCGAVMSRRGGMSLPAAAGRVAACV